MYVFKCACVLYECVFVGEKCKRPLSQVVFCPHTAVTEMRKFMGRCPFTHLFVKVYFYNKLRVGNRKLTVGFYGLEEITKPHQVGTFLVLKSSNYRKFLITVYTTHKY